MKIEFFFYLFPNDDSLAMVYIPKFIQFLQHVKISVIYNFTLILLKMFGWMI